MNCMKCGRETEEEGVFCQECLMEMEKHPILPDAVVLLPRRKETSFVKKVPKRHVPTAEEQVETLHKMVMTLLFLLGLCVILIGLMFKPTLHYVLDQHVPIGQNYSSAIPNTAPTTQMTMD